MANAAHCSEVEESIQMGELGIENEASSCDASDATCEMRRERCDARHSPLGVAMWRTRNTRLL